MDITVILIIAFGVLFCVGGPIIGHYASKAGEKAEREEAERQEASKAKSK